MTVLKTMRLVTWAAVAAVALILAVLVARQAIVTSNGVSVGAVADIGGPFRLVDETGAPVSEADLAGRPTAMFFGFTFCPDVCPTTLFEASGWLEALGPAGDDLNVVFVTVDPERDTPDVLAAYISAFDPRIRAFTGTPDAVEAMVKAYRVYARRVPLDGGGYTMDHTASVFLLDRAGAFVGTIAYGEARDTALQKLRRLVAG